MNNRVFLRHVTPFNGEAPSLAPVHSSLPCLVDTESSPVFRTLIILWTWHEPRRPNFHKFLWILHCFRPHHHSVPCRDHVGLVYRVPTPSIDSWENPPLICQNLQLFYCQPSPMHWISAIFQMHSGRAFSRSLRTQLISTQRHNVNKCLVYF